MIRIHGLRDLDTEVFPWGGGGGKGEESSSSQDLKVMIGRVYPSVVLLQKNDVLAKTSI